jgi:hypothetical protein
MSRKLVAIQFGATMPLCLFYIDSKVVTIQYGAQQHAPILYVDIPE